MRVSLNLIKKYVDLDNLTAKQIAYDLTLRTVEVESVENTKDKFHDIVVGKILEVNDHPNANLLKVCLVDIGSSKPVQIVCGGSNLYVGEKVVVAKPNAEVIWHGEGDKVTIKATKMRGEDSYGMICGATEVFLDKLFPPKDDHEIVDLKDLKCAPGDNIADVTCMDDVIFEIDNKSLTNRPDLWGHLGIAREISAIYDLPLKELPTYSIPQDLPEYEVEIKEPTKCPRYVGIEIANVGIKESPLWMKAILINTGMRPINAIVDITNYVMISTGQPMHAFDRTHVNGNKIIVRNATKGEELLLLDDNTITLTTDDLVISDTKSALGLAGIKGGKKDSILPDTEGILLEVANFTAPTIRKTGKRFDEKTDASIRYEKNIDTERVDLGRDAALNLIKELFPESKIIKYTDKYQTKTERCKIEVSEDFLNIRLGKSLPKETILKVLEKLGYDVEYKNGIYYTVAPVWRSTGDVSLKDDVLGDIARLLSYQSFDAKPLPVNFISAVRQPKVSLERKLKEYLAFRCGFNEIYTYPWVDLKYFNAARIATTNCIKLATPPAPELVNLRNSLIPGMLEVIAKNLRYFSNFKIFEMAQVMEKGEYHESSEDETLPIHKKYLTGAIVGASPKDLFYEIKGVVENMASFTQMTELTFSKEEKPSWADSNGYLNIKLGDEVIGMLGLVSVATMMDAKIKRCNVAIFELNVDKLIPNPSRTNKYIHLAQTPLVEKDLAILVDNNITWEDIKSTIIGKVKELEFIEEYHGEKIPKGKKSITIGLKLGNDDKTMTTEEINSSMNTIIKSLNKRLGAELREE